MDRAVTGYAVSSGIILLNMLFKDLIDTGVFQDKILLMLHVTDSDFIFIVRKKSKIRNRYDKIPHLT